MNTQTIAIIEEQDTYLSDLYARKNISARLTATCELEIERLVKEGFTPDQIVSIIHLAMNDSPILTDDLIADYAKLQGGSDENKS